MSLWTSIAHLAIFPWVWETYSWSCLITEMLSDTTAMRMSLLHDEDHFITAQFLSHWRDWLAWDPLDCEAAAATGWSVWTSWVVRHGSIRGFFHRRGGRLGNSGFYSRSQAERLCRWYGTRIPWVALRVLRGSDELVEMHKTSGPCYYSIDCHARVLLPSAASPLDEGSGHAGRALTYAV